VEVKGVSKKFSRSLKQSMWYGFKDMGSALFGINGNRSNLREGEFWAVKDVSFTLRRGECLGLIGHNGAGKSTLLKMLNGLIRPDEGSITMRGKIGALIELGAGFNPLLTGRENVFINGQLLGFSRKEVEKKLDAILDFAEIGEFIDSPVQNYSSGMKVRLGFAVAAQMEPDVLIIDEVLAVGDIGFRVKCMNRISELLRNCAVIFVSHSMPQVGKICTNAMVMQKGQNIFSTTVVSEAIQNYFDMFEVELASEYGNGKCQFLNYKVLNLEMNNGTYIVYKHDFFHFQADILIDKQYEKLFCIILFHDLEMKTVAIGNSIEQNAIIYNLGEKVSLDVRIPNHLSGGKFTVTIDIYEAKGENNEQQGDLLLSKRNISKIYSKGYRQAYYCPVQLPGEWKII
jgi:lipopolysaccharide transport system ATP-binding protein